MTSEDFLVWLLSILVSVILTLVIVALVYIIKIVKTVQRLSDKAESAVENVEAAGRFFKKSAQSVNVAQVVSNIVDHMKDKKGKK